jgi:hypothetical protein
MLDGIWRERNARAAMRTNATATLRATMLSAALVTLALTGLAAFAATDSGDCPPGHVPVARHGARLSSRRRDPVALQPKFASA